MEKLDANKHKHAADGKYTHKDLKESPGASDALKPPKPAPMIFNVTGAQDSFASLDSTQYGLPDFPERLPKPVTTLGYDDYGRLYMHVENPEDPEVGIFVTHKDTDDEIWVDEFTYHQGETGEERDQIDSWAQAAFKRGEAVIQRKNQQSTPEPFMKQVAAFAAGQNPRDIADEHQTHQERWAAEMQHALSGYLRPDDDEEDKADSFSDVLSNLRHYAAQQGIDFDAAIDKSERSQQADVKEDEMFRSAQQNAE